MAGVTVPRGAAAKGTKQTKHSKRKSATAARAPRPPLPGGFYALAALVAMLDIVGLAMVLSASSVHDLRVFHSAWYSFAHQLLYVVAGTAALIVAARVDYRRWRRFAPAMMAVCLLLMLLVLVPGVGVRVSVSARWLGAGPVQFQPSELTKL